MSTVTAAVAGSAAPVVELVAARKRFGSVEALKGVDLTIRAGEAVAILGPNGAGKTTAISLMLGLRRPTGGEVRLFGLPPTDRRARSRCGVMLQESGVPQVLTVRELVDLFRSYYAAPLPAERAIQLAGLEEKARSQVRDLSGGQRQRLYFALAICGDPQTLFLDEPTVGMDVEARRAFLDTIKEFARSGRTIVLTTHYLDEADELAERIVVINHGLIIADATPSAIKSQVAGKRVAFQCAGLTQATFDGLPVSHLEIDNGQVRLLSNAPEIVLRALFAHGHDLTDLEVVGADLEEAFVALTRRTPAGIEPSGGRPQPPHLEPRQEQPA